MLCVFSSTHLPSLQGLRIPPACSPTVSENLWSSTDIPRMDQGECQLRGFPLGLCSGTGSQQLSAARGRKHEVAVAFSKCSCLEASPGSSVCAVVLEGSLGCREQCTPCPLHHSLSLLALVPSSSYSQEWEGSWFLAIGYKK